MMRDLQVKVYTLTERSKSTGVIFDCKAFSSETEFVLWLSIKNPSGEGLAAWVDIIFIWAFGTANHIDSTPWITELHGLEGERGHCLHPFDVHLLANSRCG